MDTDNQHSIGSSLFQSLREKLASFSPRQRISTIIAIVALMGLPITLVALNYQQNISSKASEEDKVKLYQASDQCIQSTQLVLSDQKPNAFCLQIEEISW